MRPRFFPLALALSVLLALPAAAFSDVPADTWYASSAAQCQQAGLLKGTSSDTFSPDKTVTLAEVAVLLFDSQCERESKQVKRQSNRHLLTSFRK